MMNKIEQGDVAAGKGPCVTYGPAVQTNLLQRIVDTAEAKKIPLQRMAASRSTGTDTDAFAYSNKGVASALISLPLRYMHTTVEMVHRDDVENCIRLILATVQAIKPGEDFKYIR
jgi:putative aminopeptidase FrvX